MSGETSGRASGVRRRALLSWGVGGLVAALLAAPARAELNAVAVAARIERRYAEAKTYRASFRQVFRMAAQDVTKVSRGRLAFSRPGRMSFRYLEPKGDRVVSDGKTVSAYDASERRLYRSRQNKSPHAWVLAFLSGKGRLARDFTLRLVDTSSRSDVVGYVLEAVPRQKSPAFAKLLLFVDAKSFAVHRVLVVDALGNTNRFDLSNERLGKKLPRGEFRFRAPRGTVVVKS